MGLTQVWSEREGDIPGTVQNEGDWEACVATAYSMALLHGGVKMEKPYTQYQRELIEYYGAAADRDQNLDLSDIKSLQVYGVKLRPPSVLNNVAALSRTGVGMCLTGTGSPGGYTSGTFGHEVFWLGVNATTGLLFDPLAPAGSAPQSKSVAQMAAWARPLSATNAREVKANEFAPTAGGNMPVIEGLQGLPDGASIQIQPAREYQFFWFDPTTGAKASWAHTYATASGAGTEAIVDLTGEGPAYFLPKAYVGPAGGMRTNVYLPVGYVKDGEVFIPKPPPPAAVDCSGAVADAVAPLNQRITELEQAIISHVDEVTKPEEDLLAAVE